MGGNNYGSRIELHITQNITKVKQASHRVPREKERTAYTFYADLMALLAEKNKYESRIWQFIWQIWVNQANVLSNSRFFDGACLKLITQF